MTMNTITITQKSKSLILKKKKPSQINTQQRSNQKRVGLFYSHILDILNILGVVMVQAMACQVSSCFYHVFILLLSVLNC